ncbi:MAG: ECs_2282 family putative zinc-binding protein [Candidatus Arsenophonus phytopathogenicus]
MCNIRFKCPGCGHDLIVKPFVEIWSEDDIEGITCIHCSRTIFEEDIVN